MTVGVGSSLRAEPQSGIRTDVALSDPTIGPLKRATRSWRVRLIFLGVLVLYGLQHFAYFHIGEPYPGLFAPRFARTREFGSPVTSFTRIPVVIDSHDRRHRLAPPLDGRKTDPLNLLAGSKIVGHALEDSERADRNDLSAWICRALHDLDVRDAAAFEITLRQETRDRPGGELLRAKNVNRIVIPLRCPT